MFSLFQGPRGFPGPAGLGRKGKGKHWQQGMIDKRDLELMNDEGEQEEEEGEEEGEEDEDEEGTEDSYKMARRKYEKNHLPRINYPLFA